MKKLSLLLTILLISLPAFSQEKSAESAPPSKSASSAGESSGGSGGGGNFGLGLSLFSPTGITGKYFLDSKSSIEGAIGLGMFGDNRRNHVHAVYLYNFKAIDDAENVNLYIGGGIVMEEIKHKEKIYKGFSTSAYENAFGLRIPAGISAFVYDKKLELFGELNLNLYFINRNASDLGLAFGGRYYF